MRRKADGEQGATLVEFALILPVFMALILGTFTGGIAYNRKISLTNAARESSRYGATLPVATEASLDTWLDRVADIAEENATGDLSSGTDGRRICVAYVFPNGATATDKTRQLVRTNSGDAMADAACFSDGRPAGERRIQVELQRTSPLEVLFFTTDLTLNARSVTLFEATE